MSEIRVGAYHLIGPGDDRADAEEILRAKVAHFAAVNNCEVKWDTYRVTEHDRMYVFEGDGPEDVLLRGEALCATRVDNITHSVRT